MAEIIGRAEWYMDEDEDGTRTYVVRHKVDANITEGPQIVGSLPDLPRPGESWHFEEDFDEWAFCTRKRSIKAIQQKDEATDTWEVINYFTNKASKRCQDDEIEDPLLQPDKVRGNFTTNKEEATVDLYGEPIVSSSWERILGPQVEFDTSNPSVSIEQNVPLLEFNLLCEMIQTVNGETLWGFSPRCVKLSAISWEELWYGTCFKYYKRTLEFNINPKTFDREVRDEGSKVLIGEWVRPGLYRVRCIDGQRPDPFNPSHYQQYKDSEGHATRVVLNGKGLPAGACVIEEDCPTGGDRTLQASITVGGVITTTAECPGSPTQTNKYPPTYVSIRSSNKSNSLRNTSYWIRVVDERTNGTSVDYSFTTPYPWVTGWFYPKGRIVIINGITCVCLKDHIAGSAADTQLNLPALDGGPNNPDGGDTRGGFLKFEWLILPTRVNKGVYNYCATYTVGDYVTEGVAPSGTGTNVVGANIDVNRCDKTTPGFIWVQKYEQSDFTVLGIPDTIGP